MEKKVILVTGGAKGIGKSIITEFSKRGYDVIINYNNSYNLALKLKEEVEKKYKINAYIIKADITNEEDIKNMFNFVIKKYKKINILVNNAALACDNYIEEKSKEEFMRVLETNVVGPFLLTKIFKDNVDTIINISSTDSEDTYSDINIDYCASKAALNSLTKTTSLALPNVKIFALLLPWVNTESVREMNPTYLEKELKRTNQKELIEPSVVAQKIYEIIDSVKTGSIIRWSDIDDRY